MTRATTDLLPWITRDAAGRWTGHEYATEQAAADAVAAGEGVTVWADNHVIGVRGWGATSERVGHASGASITPAWHPAAINE